MPASSRQTKLQSTSHPAVSDHLDKLNKQFEARIEKAIQKHLEPVNTRIEEAVKKAVEQALGERLTREVEQAVAAALTTETGRRRTRSSAEGPAPTPPAPIVEISPVLAVLAATERPLSDSPFWKSQPDMPEEMGLRKIETRCKTDWPKPLLYDPPLRVDERNPDTLAKYAELDKLWDAWISEGDFSHERIEKLYKEVKEKAKYEGLGWFTNVTMFRVPRLPTNALRLVYFFAEFETNYRKAITERERQRKKKKG